MKRLLLTGAILSLVGLRLRAPAQGSFDLENTFVTNRVDVGSPGNRYTGTFGLELWLLNSSSVPAGLNTLASLSGVAAYQSLSAQGFVLEQTFVNRLMDQGQFELLAPQMPHVEPGGSTVVVALAAWNSSAPSWASMLAGADSSTRAGVIAFVQRTTDFSDVPLPPPSPLAWGVNQDLVMLPVPEPGTLVLMGLGAALLFCRHRPSGGRDRI